MKPGICARQLRPLASTVILLATLFMTQKVLAQQDFDLDALKLADQISTPVAVPSNWRVFAEAAVGGAVYHANDSFTPSQRLSFDVQYDNSFSPGWRVVFSDRLDVDNPAQAPFGNGINTIKEAYLSWQNQPDLLVDFGRINVRSGVALGYNPTDFFKTSAVRSYVSVDPNSLKENRQGSVMLRLQKLFDSGSLTMLISPKLDTRSDDAAFNPDVAATNGENRWLISYSPKIADGINPQFLLFKSDQSIIQFGLNLTYLINDATVIYSEWSGGRGPSLLAQSIQQQGIPYASDVTFRHRVASGVTYTTNNKISLTGEFDYNGAGLGQNQWGALANGPPELYGVYRNWLQTAQESPTRRAVFLYGAWQDAFVNHLDFSAMERFNLDDSSRLSWLEARYHFTRSEFALQWQLYSGRPLSEYGAAPQRQSWALLGRVYF